MKKNQLLSLSFCFLSVPFFSAVAQKSAEGFVYSSEKGVTFGAISDNGKWIVGNASVDAMDKYPTLWDVTKNEAVSLAPTEDYVCGVHDVSDDGCVVGLIEGDFFTGKPAYYKNGTWHQLPIPEGYTGGCVRSVTPDGKIMMGHIVKYPGGGMVGYEMVMVKWVDGVLTTFEAPADKFGTKSKNDLVIGVSTDGTKFAGHLAMSILPDLTPFFYENGEWSLIGDEIYQREDNLSVLEIMGMSPDLKWITGHIEYDTYYEQDEYGAWSIFRHFVYNTETKELILDLKEGPAGMGTTITKEGVHFIGCPHNYPIRQAYLKIPGDDVYYNMPQYISQEYNFDVQTIGCSDFGTVCGISEDGKTVFGFDAPGNNWILKLSEPILPSGGAAINRIHRDSETRNAYMYGRDLMINGDVQSFVLLTPDGRSLMNAEYTGEPVSLSGLNPGVYMVVLKGKSGDVSNAKIVIR